MGVNREERGYPSTRARPRKTIHPYTAIEHRVMDSEAFADLTPSAALLLFLIARQLTRDNNGHLQATFSFVSSRGMRSEHTLSRALRELIAHGFIYRTRAGGYQKTAALYAVTWLPITSRTGIYPDGFVKCAWHNWTPAQAAKPRKARSAQTEKSQKAGHEARLAPHPKLELVGNSCR
jgi:hypothetical protein